MSTGNTGCSLQNQVIEYSVSNSPARNVGVISFLNDKLPFSIMPEIKIKFNYAYTFWVQGYSVE